MKGLAATSLVCLLLAAAPATAATLSLLPAASDATPGSTLLLDVVVAGLGDAAAPSLAAFDFDIGFDPAVLSLDEVSFGGFLGDMALGEALDVSFGELAPGLVNVAEVSFLAGGTLDALQPDGFVLATLSFTVGALAGGQTTVVEFAAVAGLADGAAMPLPVDATNGAVVTGTVIPLPAALWLLLPALLVLRRRARAGGMR